MYCKYCNTEKEPVDFEICNTRNGKIYRRLKCKDCKRKTQGNRKFKIRKWFEEYKSNLYCSNCGNRDFRVLVFHHRNPSEKDGTISYMASNGISIKALKLELEKCDVLCSNCHLILHYDEKKQLGLV